MALLPLFALLFSIFATGNIAQDTIAPNQSIGDGDTLVSADEKYEVGFFSPGRSRNRYMGIWYKNISPQTVVWVANRETPITDSSGVFRVDQNGTLLVIAGSNNTVVWSSKTDSVSPSNINPLAQILNTGNLVVKQESSIIWQSFDYPGDTLLPGMKFGKDLVSGRDRRCIPWKSIDDPSPSQYAAFMDTNGFPQIFVAKGVVPVLRYGPWNGATLNGLPSRKKKAMIIHEFVMNDKEVYYRYLLVNASQNMRVCFNPEGNALVLNWIDRTQEWFQYWTSSIGMCSRYGLCGPYGRCNPDSSPTCSCMDGFKPRNPGEWRASVWSSGCRRRTALDCRPNGDGFQVLKKIKVPDTRHSRYNKSMTLDECEAACKANCSCTAYANSNITRGGSGCLMWFDDLMDVRTIDESQHDLYVRMAASDLTISGSSLKPSSNKRRRTIMVTVLILSSLVMMILVLAIMYVLSKRKRSQVKIPDAQVNPIDKEYSMDIQEDDTNLSSFSLNEILKSTNDFADDNKLGEGGFGPVYKGVMDDGREVAIKRLSKTSRQGLDEFKNELKLIAKLQHRNLVKLLGYCIQGDGSMLVYEYMPNKSLDMFIFDKVRSSNLDWSNCFHIIHGIAKGLLYLHQDSRLKIIHRDLKAGNILLDAEMNPKISDFGLARMFKEHEREAATNRIVGTLGYISPEYVIDGTFSEKSDVFSFGVLVLEIVSGKKSRGISHEKDRDNLLAHAWRLYEEGGALELLNSNICDSCVESEVLRSIHIGLLCVQHHAKDRPTMSSVVLMFDQDNALPRPKQPAFFANGSFPEVNMFSTNEVTMTILEPR